MRERERERETYESDESLVGLGGVALRDREEDDGGSEQRVEGDLLRLHGAPRAAVEQRIDVAQNRLAERLGGRLLDGLESALDDGLGLRDVWSELVHGGKAEWDVEVAVGSTAAHTATTKQSNGANSG